MTYQETIEYLFNSTPVFEHVGASAYKPGLQTTETLDAHFGHPHRQFKTIHVAGTNGKGSVSHTLAAILQCAGYKVGLYTSPHLVDFRERIRINGECISEQYVVDFVEKERAFFEPLHPSFFELTTALAFRYFAEQQIDIAVIEVGLGGRLDCTNIIHPILSIITNISFDHTQFLGNTLAAIAAEKGGIIKQDTPVVIGQYLLETHPVFEQIARKKNAPLYLAEDFSTPWGDVPFQLKGDYQKQNIRTILCAATLLGLQRKCVEDGMQNVSTLTGLLGRWQKVQVRPTVVCDTGHNVAGWEWLSRQLARQQCKQLRIIFGMVDDKDIQNVMKLLPKNAVYYFTKASTKRAIPEKDVKAIGDQLGLKSRTFTTVREAYEQATKDAAAEDFIFIGGSSYIVADFLTNATR